MKLKVFQSQSSPLQRILGLFSSLAVCLFMFGHTALAAELQFGLSGVSISGSNEHKGTAIIMPTVSLQTSVDQYRRLKVELGTLKYSVEKLPNRTLSEGDIGVKAFSIAGILSTKAILTTKDRQMNFNVGFGFVNYEYDNKMTPDTGGSGPVRTKEEISGTYGLQFILGMDFILGKNFLLSMEARHVNVNPKAALHFDDLGKKKIEVEKLDFSHTWVAVSLAYLFDF